MTDNEKHRSPHIDNQLADFTDTLLSKDGEDKVELSTQDQEVRELQETVVRLHRAIGSDAPSKELARRIHTRLADEWKEAELNASAETFWQRWLKRLFPPRSTWQSSSRRQRRTALAAVATVILIAIILLPFSSYGDSVLTGSAGGDDGLLPAFVVVGGVIGLILLWQSTRKKG